MEIPKEGTSTLDLEFPDVKDFQGFAIAPATIVKPILSQEESEEEHPYLAKTRKQSYH